MTPLRLTMYSGQVTVCGPCNPCTKMRDKWIVVFSLGLRSSPLGPLPESDCGWVPLGPSETPL